MMTSEKCGDCFLNTWTRVLGFRKLGTVGNGHELLLLKTPRDKSFKEIWIKLEYLFAQELQHLY